MKLLAILFITWVFSFCAIALASLLFFLPPDWLLVSQVSAAGATIVTVGVSVQAAMDGFDRRDF